MPRGSREHQSRRLQLAENYEVPDKPITVLASISPSSMRFDSTGSFSATLTIPYAQRDKFMPLVDFVGHILEVTVQLAEDDMTDEYLAEFDHA